MQRKVFLVWASGAALITAGALSAGHPSAGGLDPLNAASPALKTTEPTRHETLGCPASGLLNAPCPKTTGKSSLGESLVASQAICSQGFAQTAGGCVMPDTTKPVKRLLEGVNFDSDQATLRPDTVATLDRTATNLKEWGDIKVEVAGYTDRKGNAAHNRDLSQRRANAVRAYLIDRGVAAGRLTARGYGGSSPVAGNATVADRAKNRRVELVSIR